MSEDNATQPLPESISEEADRERSVRLGSVSLLHIWWARRPGVIARVATYLALTEKQSPSDEFLASLGAVTPSSATLATASADIRDARWIWAWRDKENELDEGGRDRAYAGDPVGTEGARPLRRGRDDSLRGPALSVAMPTRAN